MHHYFNLKLNNGIVQVALSNFIVYIFVCMIRRDVAFANKNKVQMIKTLRTLGGLGLAEAKWLIEFFIETPADIDSTGTVHFRVPEQLVTYLGTKQNTSLGDLLLEQMGMHRSE